MKKTLLFIFLCFALITSQALGSSLSYSKSNSDLPVSVTIPAGISIQEDEVIRLVNLQRSKAGLKPLQKNPSLSNVSRVKAQDMANKNYFSHTSPTYGSPFDMMKKFGIRFTAAGENIALGQTTPAAVMNSWMNSSGHRANILNPSFTQIGVGLAKNSQGRNYWVQQFIRP